MPRATRYALVLAGVLGLTLAALLAAMLVILPVDRLMTSSAQTLDSSASSTREAAAAVRSAAQAADAASRVADDLAAASDQAADAMLVEIFGTRPLEPASGRFRTLAANARTLSGELTTTGTHAAASADELEELANRLDEVRDRSNQVSAAFPPGPWLSVFGWVLVGWLIVQSVASLWLARTPRLPELHLT